MAQSVASIEMQQLMPPRTHARYLADAHQLVHPSLRLTRNKSEHLGRLIKRALKNAYLCRHVVKNSLLHPTLFIKVGGALLFEIHPRFVQDHLHANRTVGELTPAGKSRKRSRTSRSALWLATQLLIKLTGDCENSSKKSRFIFELLMLWTHAVICGVYEISGPGNGLSTYPSGIPACSLTFSSITCTSFWLTVLARTECILARSTSSNSTSTS